MALRLFWITLIILSQSLSGQSTVGRELAHLRQDMQQLQTEINRLKQEIAELRRENSLLRERAGQSTAVTMDQFTREVAALRAEALAADARQEQSTLQKVGQQLESLAQQTQSALQALAKSIEGAPTVQPTIQFSDDFPKSGVAYTIQPGDTLSKIAERFNSSVKDIQNANRITNPALIQAGQSIFVPQGNEEE